MKTDYVLIEKISSHYSYVFKKEFFFLTGYNPKLGKFSFEIPLLPYDKTQIELFEGCAIGDVIEITKEKPYQIIQNLSSRKRRLDFDKQYAVLQQQKQKN